MAFEEVLTFEDIENIILRLERDENFQAESLLESLLVSKPSLLIINNGNKIEYEKMIGEIPNSLKLGMSKSRLNTTIPLAFLINQILKSDSNDSLISDIIEIGSGKGYLSRILANYFDKRLFCVDLNQERLVSNLRVNRLIQNDTTKDTFSRFSSFKKTATLEDRKMISSNMMMFAKKLENDDDFIEAVDKSKDFFKIGESKDKLEFNVAFIGLHLCGDLIYNTIDQIRILREYNSDNLDRVNIDQLIIVPCCFDKITKYPRSKRLKKIFVSEKYFNSEYQVNKSISLCLIDFFYYGLEMGISEIYLHCINEGEWALVGKYPE